jgi:hypothetical protein
MGKSNNPWFFESFFRFIQRTGWGPGRRIFYFGFGTKAAILKMRCGCHRQLVNKVVIIVTRLWPRSRRIKRKEK